MVPLAGHIAFNEPGSSLKSKTRVKTLAYDTIVANARFFDNDISQVPRLALTVGVDTVMQAREIILLVTGASKAIALYHAVEEGVSHMWTCSALQQHSNSMVVCDDDATLELKVKTVKYFKGLMQVTKGFTAVQVAALKRPRSGSMSTGATSYAPGQSAAQLPPAPGPSPGPPVTVLSLFERLLPLLVPLLIAKVL